MTNVPYEPDWDAPEPPPDEWDNLEPPDEADWSVPEWDADLPAVAPNAWTELNADLAAVAQHLERNEANENTQERELTEDRLREEQAALEATLAALGPASGITSDDPAQAVLDTLAEYDAAEGTLTQYQSFSFEEGGLDGFDWEPTDTPVDSVAADALVIDSGATGRPQPNDLSLVEARFLGRTERDEAGEPLSYHVQYLELYQDTNADYTGQLLDVGHFADRDTAEQQYFLLQGEARGGQLTTLDLAAVAEEVAEHNGLDPHAWREVTPDDLDVYLQHAYAQAELDRDTPAVAADPLLLRAALQGAGLDPVEAARQQAELENAQAVAALRAIGLEAPPGFDLVRDSFLDEHHGGRVINGIFQQDLNDPSANCRPTFVALNPGTDGIGLQAVAAEFGQVGSFEQATTEWSVVQIALQDGGVTQALEAIESVELAQALAPSALPEPEVTATAWSRDID